MPRTTTEPDVASQRARMVEKIHELHAALDPATAVPAMDPRVLDVMGRLPRHAFVPADAVADAYGNAPLAIGQGQTISQPFIVALMSSLAAVEPQHRVLEIGTGSGYQTAVLAALAEHVFTVEAVAELAAQAGAVLRANATANVSLRIGDGHDGWPEEAPFDVIVVTAAPQRLPTALVEQLVPGGRLVIPYGHDLQMLSVIERFRNGEVRERPVLPVRFVPLVPA